MKIWLLLASTVVLLTTTTACTTLKSERSRAWPNIWLPFAPERVKQVYKHSLVASHRDSSDCAYHCPDVDIWLYQFKDPKSKNLLTSKDPIATQKKFWKAPDEARIIAISLFDGKEFYYRALLQYLESFKHIKKVNNINDEIWGYETFTVRVYVSKRNPEDLARLGEIKNRTPDYIIDDLLERGCEIAYVDNKLDEAKKDGTFWRFAVAADQMPQKERLRYIMRDADNILTAVEMYAVADWIRSDYRYHRMHIIPICFGPLTAMLWGGSHTGTGDFADYHDLVKNYPYRFQYGDDELFSRDLLWPRLKSVGSILTHHFKRSPTIMHLASPYEQSCEEPTEKFCEAFHSKSPCEDRILPEQKNLSGAVEALGLRKTLADLQKDMPYIFDLELNREDRHFIYEAFKSR